MGRGVLAKAMVISIDKATAVRMYDKVRKHWKAGLARLRRELLVGDPVDKPELEERLRFFEETDMAVVVSQSQNEIEEFRKKGLDIATHRKRMVKEDLEGNSRIRTIRCGSCSSAPCGSPALTCRPAPPSTWTSR